MIGLVVVSHSHRIAEGVVELARAVAGQDVRIAAAGGLDMPDSPLGTDPLRVARAIDETYSEAGVLVLMDLGSAVLSAEMALDLIAPDRRDHVLLCEAPLVEGAVAAAVEAGLGSDLARAAAQARAALGPKADHLRGPHSQDMHAVSPTSSAASPPFCETLAIANPLGLHARPAARCVRALAGLDAEVTLRNETTGRGPVNARSIHGLALLDARQGHTLQAIARGPDAPAALAALSALARSRFGDVEPLASAAPQSPVTAFPAPPAAGKQTVETETFKALAASPGLGIGPVRKVQPAFDTTEAPAEPVDPHRELAAFERAMADARAFLRRLQADLTARAQPDAADILFAQALLLEDDALLKPTRRAIQAGSTAAHAWQETVRAVIAGYDSLDDATQRARAGDVHDVARHVGMHLAGRPYRRISLSSPGILVAEDLTPAEAATLDPAEVLGVCTACGGPTSHSAVLLRSVGIPAIVGAEAIARSLAEGTVLILDGATGQCWVDPRPQWLDACTRKLQADKQALLAAQQTAAMPAITRDGRRVEVRANIGSPAGARAAAQAGADGVGLFRTEFMFMRRLQAPDETEQAEAYMQVAQAMGGRPVLIRTLDAGGDKPLPYLNLDPESNPFLGCRGIRVSLAHPALFLQQLRAIARTAMQFPIQIMFPMVTTAAEWRAALAWLDKACSEVGLPNRPETGVMVEVPALALQAEHFAAEVDFFSIGTNDLTQYTLAAERGHPRLSSLADALHPAVLRLIARVADAAHTRGKWVGICGELAADPRAVPLLVGLGADELSVSPPAIVAVKQAVRGVSLPEAKRLAEAAMASESPEEVRALLGMPSP
jgi:phosphocarrier protein FPr